MDSTPRVTELGDVKVGQYVYFRAGETILYGSREAFACPKRHRNDCVVLSAGSTAYHRSKRSKVVEDRHDSFGPRTFSPEQAERMLGDGGKR